MYLALILEIILHILKIVVGSLIWREVKKMLERSDLDQEDQQK